MRSPAAGGVATRGRRAIHETALASRLRTGRPLRGWMRATRKVANPDTVSLNQVHKRTDLTRMLDWRIANTANKRQRHRDHGRVGLIARLQVDACGIGPEATIPAVRDAGIRINGDVLRLTLPRPETVGCCGREDQNQHHGDELECWDRP